MNLEGYRKATAGQHKGGERLVLALIALCAEGGTEADVDGLVDDTGLSAKQILRITAKLKADGAIIVKGGTGRAPYTFTPASANADKMSSQTTQDKTSAQDIKSPQGVRSVDKMSSLADAGTKSPDNEARSEDKKSGTPVAPSKAKNTSTDKPEANASGAKRGDGVQAYIGRLLRFRRRDLRVKTLPVEQGEAAAAKWMHSQGWPLGSVGWCYRALKRQGWRGQDVTLIDVKKQYPAWKKGDLNNGKRTEPRPSKPSRAETVRNRDYSVFDRAGGEDAGADSRPLPRVEILAGQIRR